MQSASEPSGAAISSRSSRFQDVNRSTSSLDSAVESINSGDEAVVERSPSRSPSVPSTHFDFSESDAGPPSYNQQPPDSMSRQHSLTALEQENAELRERLATLEKNVSSRLGASGSSGTGNTSTNCAQGENEGLEDETERLRSQLEDAEQRLAALVAVHRRENLELEERISKLSLTEGESRPRTRATSLLMPVICDRTADWWRDILW
jgi:cell shape-determining protein MreC